MQLKMPQNSDTVNKPDKLSQAQLTQLLTQENEFIENLCERFDVPETIEDENEFDLYLKNASKIDKQKLNLKKLHKPETNGVAKEERVVNETFREKKNQDKLKENKLKAKKGGLKKSKKAKLKKELKKRVVTQLKATKNEQQKEEKLDKEEKKVDTSQIEEKKVFNKEGKIVFSKVEFPKSGSKFDQPKKSNKGKDKIEKNPIKLIKQLKDQQSEIKELEKSGDAEAAVEKRQEIAWRKVFDRTEGKKVKDNPELIMKGLKQRRSVKHKSKKLWKDRKAKVEKGIADRQKKREDNIEKKQSEKKGRKLKKLTKKGRVISGA